MLYYYPNLGLSVDIEDQRLYWVDMEVGLIQYYDFQTNLVKDVSILFLCSFKNRTLNHSICSILGAA